MFYAFKWRETSVIVACERVMLSCTHRNNITIWSTEHKTLWNNIEEITLLKTPEQCLAFLLNNPIYPG
jgi:hypothetical protein